MLNASRNPLTNKLNEIIINYSNYDEVLISNDIINKLNEDSTYYDVFKLFENHYSYLVNTIKDNNGDYEEYQKFLDSSNALAEAFPQLVVRVDEFGNKLVGPDELDGKVGQVSDSINGMLDDMRKTADIKMFKELKETMSKELEKSVNTMSH